MNTVRNVETSNQEGLRAPTEREEVLQETATKLQGEVVQLRAAVAAMHQRMETLTQANNDTQPSSSNSSAGGTRRLQAIAMSLLRKLFLLGKFLFGTVSGFFRRIVTVAVVLAIAYELLVVVPMVGYPGAVKAELGEQVALVKQWAAEGWQAAMAIAGQQSGKDGEAAADKRNPHQVGK